jgi:PhnB protein
MSGKTNVAPKGFHTATPNMITGDAPVLLKFLKDGLGGEEVAMVRYPDGGIRHAEVLLGDTRIFLGQETLDRPAMACRVYLFVENVDKAYARALRTDAVGLSPPHDAFYGDRVAVIRDPVGNHWTLAKRRESLSDAEKMRRLKAMNPKDSI